MTKVIETLRHPGGWVVVPVHYSMDAEKDMNWAEKQRASYQDPEDWEKEMEINFQSISGQIAIENFNLIANTANNLTYAPALPLRLACDFNVNPMAWLISQVKDDVLYVLEEIFLKPGSVAKACDEFLNRFGHHQAEVFIYGDAAGRARSQLNQRTNYDEIEMRFRGRRFSTKLCVPRANPPVLQALKSLNLKMRDKEGKAGIIIDQDKCPQFLSDLSECVMTDDGKGVKEERNPNHPYFYRGHLLAAARYMVDWLWPFRKPSEKRETDRTPRERRQKRYFGVLK